MGEEAKAPTDPAAASRLFDLYDRMIADVQVPEVLRDVADVVCRDFDAERATVYLVDEATQELESVALIGNVPRVIRVPIGETSLAGFCAAARRAFVVPDAYGDLSDIAPTLRFDESWDRINRFRTRDVMCAPALFKGRLVGVVQAVNSKGRPFGDDDLAWLQSVSRLIGYALHHARLYDDIAKLKQLEKQKADFMRVMVHELKSPVSAARMMTDLLRSRHAEQPQAAELAERIAERMDQLGQLIRDILDLAWVKSGEPMGRIEVIDLGQAVREVCGPYRDQAEAKGLAMAVDVPPSPVGVRIDVQACRLAVSNLVSNAVKYTPAGSVSVSLRSDGGWAVLQVRDTGIGIPQEDMGELFGEFYRASNAKREGIQGTGVGLAAVKQIVERFGGQLELESRENEGTTFLVRLPLSAAP